MCTNEGGGWKNNEFHGQGTYTTADGEVKEGTWRDGEFLE